VNPHRLATFHDQQHLPAEPIDPRRLPVQHRHRRRDVIERRGFHVGRHHCHRTVIGVLDSRHLVRRAVARRPSDHGRAALAFIFITVMLDMLALGMIIPVLPKLIEQFEGGDTASAARLIGVFGTLWASMQFLASPILGALSDHFGPAVP
jgi:hypothetical protein